MTTSTVYTGEMSTEQKTVDPALMEKSIDSTLQTKQTLQEESVSMRADPDGVTRLTIQPGTTLLITSADLAQPASVQPVETKQIVESFEGEASGSTGLTEEQLAPFANTFAAYAFPIPMYLMRVLKIFAAAGILYLLYFGLRFAMRLAVGRRLRRGGMGFPEEYASADFDSVEEPVTTDYVPYESVGQDEVAAPPGGFPQWGEEPAAEVPEPVDEGLFSIFGGMREEMIEQLAEEE